MIKAQQVPAVIAAALAVLASVFAMPAAAQFAFSEQAVNAGIDRAGESYGSSWGDVNGDGLPDLYANNHREAPSLWVNQGDGTFNDIGSTVEVWARKPFLDQHGAAWADFNNDGLQDLLGTMGASDDNQFLINEGGQLVDRVAELNFQYTNWPGRMPFWVDYNRDGLLDVSVMQRGRARLFRQSATGTLVDVSNTVNIRCENTQYAQLADINFDDRLDIVCMDQGTWPDRIYDMSTVPFTELTSTLPPINTVIDTAIGDFNNDQRIDFLAVRGTLRPSEAALDGNRRIEAQLITENRPETLTFRTAGALTLEVNWNGRNVSRFFIGSGGRNPTGIDPNGDFIVSVDPADPNTWGIKPHTDSDSGIYLGYDPATQEWELSVVSGGVWQYTYWFIDSTQNISNLNLTGIGGNEISSNLALIMATDSGYVDQANARGLAQKRRCVAAVSADFNNDMYEDIYLVCRGGVSNEANVLLANQGDGTFVEVANAAGAAGPVGLGFGTGDTVSTADYNMDGYMDLFVNNGLNLRPLPPDSRGGPDLLFRNEGSGNNWIELELFGTASNASAIGAKVYATAGGVTQLREQDGGYHRWTQDHQRLHFGLAQNDFVNLTIKWPNGGSETYNNVPANRIYRVVEGSGYEELNPTGGPITTVSIDDVSALESDAFASFTVSLSAPSSEVVSIDYQTVDGTAVAGTDYLIATDTLIFNPGVTSLPIDVELIDNSSPDGTRRFDVVLSNAVGVLPAKSAGTATIVDDDQSPCGPPEYSGSTDDGIFLWEDCATGNWIMRSVAGGDFARFVGSVTASSALSNVSGFSIEGHDTFDLSNPNAVSFNFRIWGTSEDGFDFSVGNPATTCFETGTDSDTSVVFVGPARVAVSTPFNLGNLGPCDGSDPGPDPDPDPDPSDIALGEPAYSPGTESGVWVWRTAEGQWYLRATGGGDFGQHIGSIAASASFDSVLPFSIEAHDVFNVSATPAVIDFNLRIWGNAEDGIDFRFPSGTDVCLNVVSTTGIGVFLGQDRTPVTTPYNLGTAGACP